MPILKNIVIYLLQIFCSLFKQFPYGGQDFPINSFQLIEVMKISGKINLNVRWPPHEVYILDQIKILSRPNYIRLSDRPPIDITIYNDSQRILLGEEVSEIFFIL